MLTHLCRLMAQNVTPTKIYTRNKNKNTVLCRLCTKSVEQKHALRIFSHTGKEWQLQRKIAQTSHFTEDDNLTKQVTDSALTAVVFI